MSKTQVLEFGVRVEAPEEFKGIPVHVKLIGLKPLDELAKADPPGELFLLFNLDVFGGKPDSKIAVGEKNFTPDITVYFSYSRMDKLVPVNLLFWIPDRGWTSYDSFLTKDPKNDMQISDFTDNSFKILKWPVDDRVVCWDG